MGRVAIFLCYVIVNGIALGSQTALHLICKAD